MNTTHIYTPPPRRTYTLPNRNDKRRPMVEEITLYYSEHFNRLPEHAAAILNKT
jgi:hypothetical protein